MIESPPQARVDPEAEALITKLRSPSRRPELVEARRQVARAMREKGCSYPEIGRALNRHHATIIYLLNPHPKRTPPKPYRRKPGRVAAEGL